MQESNPVSIPTPVPSVSGVTRLNPRHFRMNSKGRARLCNFVLNHGGVGDYLCYLQAIRYVASESPQITGMVYTPEHVVELAAYLLKPWYPRFQVFDRSAIEDKKLMENPTFAPSLKPLNATGAHPLDLGFIYFASINPPPKDYNFYPRMDFPELASEVPEVPYAVMTPGATTANRTMPFETFNGIKDHLIKRGITPMFLGKKDVTDIRRIEYPEGNNYDGGIDMRDKTTLIQATGLMSKAKLVVGLDNGLLHLAACTDVPIIFGYNIASPVHRRPRRPSGNIWEIFPDKEKLPCTFCQSDMRFMFDHDYAYCLYKDNMCLDALKNPKPWRDIIDNILVKSGVTLKD